MPQKGRLLVEHNTGATGTATPGTSITTGAASGTKGTTVQLIASTAFDTYLVRIFAYGYGLAATDSQGCLDILVGAATEEILIPDLLMGYCGSAFAANNWGYKSWLFPLYIPAGTRISARAAGQRVSTAMRVVVYCFGGDGMPPFRVGSKVTTYGVTVPVGTTVAPGASGAEGNWAQITASTSEDHFAVLPSFQAGTDTTLSDRAFAFDIGVGAATEEEIAQSYWFATNINEQMQGPNPDMPTFVDIPSASRLTVRASNSGTNDAGNYNAALHCLS